MWLHSHNGCIYQNITSLNCCFQFCLIIQIINSNNTFRTLLC